MSLYSKLLTQNGGGIGNPGTIIFDKSMSDPANITGDINGKDIAEIVSRHRRCLCKKTAEGEVAICYLNDTNSNQYHDGSPAILTGEEGDVMVTRPEFWYKWAKVDDNKFSYTIFTEPLEDGIHVEQCLIGAYKACGNGGKLYSRSKVTPIQTRSTTIISYAQARGKGYSTIDFEQHCMIALICYAKYGTRNIRSILGSGGALSSLFTTGNSDSTGISDIQQSGNYNCGLGIEGIIGALPELVSGVEINKFAWTITYPDGSKKTVNAYSKAGQIIAHIKAEDGPEFEIIPTYALRYSEEVINTYYTDGYNSYDLSVDPYLSLARASSLQGQDGNISGVSATYAAVEKSDGSIGARLTFRGNITVIDNVEEFKALPVL